MAKCNKQTEEICLCKDCAVTDCKRYDCQECNETPHKDVHDVFCCNCYREVDCSK